MSRKTAHFFGVCLILSLLFSSCIPIKDMVYVQKTGDDGEVTAYTSEKQEYVYKLRARDVVVIQLTEDLGMGQSLNLSGGLTNVTNTNSQKGGGRSYVIDDDGNVTFSEIGSVHIAGLTLFEARLEIESKTVGFIPDPVIKIELRSYVVKVLGEVNLPGAYQVRTEQPTLFEAIGLANGLTSYANRKEVQVIRSTGDAIEVEYVDVTDPEFLNSRFYYVHPGDVISFKPLPGKRLSDNTATYALSLLSTLAVIINLLTR